MCWSYLVVYCIMVVRRNKKYSSTALYCTRHTLFRPDLSTAPRETFESLVLCIIALLASLESFNEEKRTYIATSTVDAVMCTCNCTCYIQNTLTAYLNLFRNNRLHLSPFATRSLPPSVSCGRTPIPGGVSISKQSHGPHGPQVSTRVSRYRHHITK